MSKSAKVLKIAIPAVGEMPLYVLVWVVDTALIGNWGNNTIKGAKGGKNNPPFALSKCTF